MVLVTTSCWVWIVCVAEVTVKLSVLKTGSPTWTTLQKIDVAEFRARAFKFQTNFVALDPTWNIEVSQLSAVVEESA